MPTAKTNPRLIHKNEPWQISHARTICLPDTEVSAFCQDAGNLTRILKNVLVTANGRKELTVTLAHKEAEPIRIALTTERGGKATTWRCDEGDHAHEGRVTFVPAPGDEGTEVSVLLRPLGDGAKIDGEAVADVLRRAKALLEAGEIPTIDGQPVGEPQKSELKK